MKQAFKEISFSPEKMGIVQTACAIIDEYEAQGYKLSLRQLYYQLVARNVVENTERSYKRVGDIIGDARMAGLADWDMIEDRNRETVTAPHWKSPGDIVAACASQYREDKWATQPFYCEVMVEKQALEGVLEPVCRDLDVPFTANKGYSSITLMYEAGQRLMEQFRSRCIANGLMPDKFKDERGLHFSSYLAKEGRFEQKTPVRLNPKALKAGFPRIVVFYLGDHDPSGIDMTRDVQDRLQMFSDLSPIEVRRLALNMDQIEELDPPENPAKMTDSRAADYVARFGESSWELDAVAPDALADLVREAVASVRDEYLWAQAVEKEKVARTKLAATARTLQ